MEPTVWYSQPWTLRYSQHNNGLLIKACVGKFIATLQKMTLDNTYVLKLLTDHSMELLSKLLSKEKAQLCSLQYRFVKVIILTEVIRGQSDPT